MIILYAHPWWQKPWFYIFFAALMSIQLFIVDTEEAIAEWRVPTALPVYHEPVKTMDQMVMNGYRISVPMVVEATAYDACIICCGKTDGITKSGHLAEEWYTVAVDPDLIPLGTKIYVPAFGRVFEAQDIGGKIRGRRIDFFLPDHESAIIFGRQELEIYLLTGPDSNY
ncbi:hypothetical protein F9B85_08855 [Heliorestis acidaminivorans]|uniref:3D domain-containing protein n=1 Tax=Heliorestis acidaminivorans TaxID=553427 RepID=A0A6I0ET87_9FIRM|nr:3D domain-containing protein [Heliorestis acidaminivorans]KAB2952268.1 hypothetical protein F9B85_08855 [Heliorestis acidaminivorans]